MIMAKPREPKPDFTPTEAAALVTAWLYSGARLRTSDVARKLGLTTQGACALMSRLSRVIPLTRESERGRWYILEK